MKFTYTLTLAGKVFLAFLAFTIILSITAIFVKKVVNQKLYDITRLARHVNGDQGKSQQVLLLLQHAEEDFQQSLLNPDSSKSNSYKFKTRAAIDQIDSLLKDNKNVTSANLQQNINFKELYRKKINLSSSLVVLKHQFDSLLAVYAEFNNTGTAVRHPHLKTIKKEQKQEITANADTLKTVAPPEKKGLFGRLKDAISNKNTSSREVVVIKQDKQSNTAKITNEQVFEHNGNAYAAQLKLLQSRNNHLLDTQRRLMVLNSRINKELERIVLELKDINYEISNELKAMVVKAYSETNATLSKFYISALLLVIIFAVLLIIFVIKLNKSEISLRTENKRSIAIAQQKTDLLLHLSHEIRNPLTAIQGFLHIFGRTPLNERQKDMLGSITGASDMLLMTLNDTLDAVKMENSEFVIHNEPFFPDKIIKQVVDSMLYSADKKNLYLSYNFKGSAQTMLMGDSFRLKQILVNLLSNAIKYTLSGGVTVKARLENNGLNVDITDTGLGISAEQQVNLFSKYYQTSSSHGQMGTGLGLYICKQLIELQKGKILVRSEVGKGSTFSFFIPYQQAKSHEILRPEDAIPLLNGLNILAVDDNEINLLLLKAILTKWNVNCYSASSGESALEFLEKQQIDILITDINLPGISGNQLMEKIRSLHQKFGDIPVIAVSGNDDQNDNKNYEEKGFSGFVLKPFTDQDLLTQLAKSLL